VRAVAIDALGGISVVYIRAERVAVLCVRYRATKAAAGGTSISARVMPYKALAILYYSRFLC